MTRKGGKKILLQLALITENLLLGQICFKIHPRSKNFVFDFVLSSFYLHHVLMFLQSYIIFTCLQEFKKIKNRELYVFLANLFFNL